MHFDSFYERVTAEAQGIAALIRSFFAFILKLFGKATDEEDAQSGEGE